MTDREIMQQALDHLVSLADDLRRIPSDIAQTIAALEAALAQPEQSKYSDIVSDGGLDPRNKFDAQPEFDTPESHIVKWSIPVDPNNFGEPLAQPEPFKPDWVSYRQGVADGAAQPEQEEPLPLVDIGVDVTSGGTHVVACYNRPDAVQEMFYSQFHPLAKPEQEPKLSDAGVDTNIPLWGLEPKGEGMVTLNQVGMRVDLKDGTRKEWVGLTDEQIQLMAHNDDKGDWSDLRFRSCWHNGYVDGVNAANTKLKEKNT